LLACLVVHGFLKRVGRVVDEVTAPDQFGALLVPGAAGAVQCVGQLVLGVTPQGLAGVAGDAGAGDAVDLGEESQEVVREVPGTALRSCVSPPGRPTRWGTRSGRGGTPSRPPRAARSSRWAVYWRHSSSPAERKHPGGRMGPAMRFSGSARWYSARGLVSARV